jgi:3-phosphoshikimate 1-carboxyvinyltransferase
MNIRITPGPLAGTVTPPPSKSQAHRLLIAAALSGGFSVLKGLAQSQDIQATAGCLRAMGAYLEEPENGDIRVHGLGNSIPQHREPWLVKFDCGESGSTLRFLIPVALAVQGGGIFIGRGRLMERPQRPYFNIFDEKGIFYEQKDGALTVRGELTPGEYRLPGNVSSQFVTGLLYALPLLDGDSRIVLTSPLESRGYVDMTLDALGRFGVRAEAREDGWLVPGGQKYRPCSMTVEADWSQAAFWYGAIALGSSLELEGLNAFSIQGDMKIVPCFLKLQGRGELELDVSDCPDLAPPLAAMAALRAGEITRLTNAARLRMKESDRLSSVTRALNALGADVEEGPDFLTITGRDSLAGGAAVDCCSDHRVAMMAAVAATRCKAPVTLLGAECVQKSYPNFWEEYKRLGGKLDVI